MTQKVKAAPGRPKTQPKVVQETTVKEPVLELQVKPQPVKKPKRNIKRKEQVLQHAEYEIPKNAGIVYMLPQKGITVYDEDKDTVREMRYCPNEPSMG